MPHGDRDGSGKPAGTRVVSRAVNYERSRGAAGVLPPSRSAAGGAPPRESALASPGPEAASEGTSSRLQRRQSLRAYRRHAAVSEERESLNGPTWSPHEDATSRAVRGVHSIL